MWVLESNKCLHACIWSILLMTNSTASIIFLRHWVISLLSASNVPHSKSCKICISLTKKDFFLTYHLSQFCHTYFLKKKQEKLVEENINWLYHWDRFILINDVFWKRVFLSIHSLNLFSLSISAISVVKVPIILHKIISIWTRVHLSQQQNK